MSELRKLVCQAMIAILAFTVTIMIAGCAGRVEPVQKVVTVKVPVIKPCIDKTPTRPVYDIGRGDYPGGPAAAKALAGDFEKAEQYGHDWEAAAAGCLVVPAAKP